MSSLLMPRYLLYINGKELDDFRYSMITDVVYEDNATGSDLLKITVEDPEFLFINDNIFLEDNKVKFMGGFDNTLTAKFEGYISVIDIDFPETGAPTLTINCMDNTHLMNRVKKKKTWNNTTRAKVAKEIFQSYGFKVVIEDSGTVEESITQNNETDIAFLTKIVDEEIEPYLVYVEGTTGYYVKKKILASPQDILDYRDGEMNILSFSPRINKETKQVEARYSDVNLKDKAVDKGQANDNTSKTVSGDSVSSTDRTNGQPSWKYDSKTGWTKTY